MLNMDSRLRVACGIAKNETFASIKVFQILKRRGHPEGPPPIISDGWDGIDEAMLAVYGNVPEYSGGEDHPLIKRPDLFSGICKWSNSGVNMGAYKGSN
jgi:hypothetical protein